MVEHVLGTHRWYAVFHAQPARVMHAQYVPSHARGTSADTPVAMDTSTSAAWDTASVHQHRRKARSVPVCHTTCSPETIVHGWPSVGTSSNSSVPYVPHSNTALDVLVVMFMA
jgi:hypothetical protein